jgi:hypothetical protein
MQLAALHMLHSPGNGGVHQRYVAAQHIGHRLSAPFVGHMDQLGAGALLEQLARDVRRAPGARGAIRKPAGLRLGQRDHLAQGFRG